MGKYTKVLYLGFLFLFILKCIFVVLLVLFLLLHLSTLTLQFKSTREEGRGEGGVVGGRIEEGE